MQHNCNFDENTQTGILIYKALARPLLPYGSESRKIRSKAERKLISVEIGFKTGTAVYVLSNHSRNAKKLCN